MEVFSRCYGDSSTPPAPSMPDVIRLSLAGDVEGLTRRLADTGCSPDAVDAERRRTGLHHAAARGHDGVMAALLASGADPNFQDIHGNAPLHLCGHAMTLTLLLGYGADPRLTNATGIAPAEMMRRRGVADEIINQLIDYQKGYGDDDDDEDEEVVGVGQVEGEEGIFWEAGNESIALRHRRTMINAPSNFVGLERDDDEDVDFDSIEHSLRERLLTPDSTHISSDAFDSFNNTTNNPTTNTAANTVFTIMGGACRRRRRRGFRAAFEQRPVSVFHEFFLSMDVKTLVFFVFCIFCLALLAAFYVTGVRMNYFGGAEAEEDGALTKAGVIVDDDDEGGGAATVIKRFLRKGDVIVERNDDDMVKMVPLT